MSCRFRTVGNVLYLTNNQYRDKKPNWETEIAPKMKFENKNETGPKTEIPKYEIGPNLT